MSGYPISRKNPRDILNHENKNPRDFTISNQIKTFEIKNIYQRIILELRNKIFQDTFSRSSRTPIRIAIPRESQNSISF